jgi:HK97 family phage major capsid protein
MFVELKKDYFHQPAGARVDVDESTAASLIAQGIAAKIDGDPLTPMISRSLETMLSTLTKSLNDAVDTTLKRFAETQSKSRRHAVPALFGPTTGDPQHTFGGYLLAIRRGDAKALEAMGSHWADWENTKAALTTQTGAQGGYTVPTDFLPALLHFATESAIVRKRATLVPMASKSVQVPVLDVTTAPSAGDTAFLGGVLARWTEEAGNINETEPAFKQIELTNHELMGYSKISNTLLADNAVGLETFLLTLFGRAIAWYEDYAFLRGNGVGKPLGILNATPLISVTRSGASAFALTDAANMMARLLPGWDPMHTVWAIHPTVLPKLMTMTDTASGHVVWIDNARDRPKMSLFGIPVETTEKLPALNTLGDVLLLDLQHYLLGDRQQIEIAFSEHVAFLNNQGVWRFVSRVDGQPWLRDKVTLADASSTLSPFVGLAAG